LQEFVTASDAGLLSPKRVDGTLEAVTRLLRTPAVRDG
jgi:hypothetical protein